MPKITTDGRISSLEANQAGLFKSIGNIEQYMKDGIELRVQNTADITQIKSCVLAFQQYQNNCDGDRAAQDKRIISLERHRVYAKGFAGALVFILGILGFTK